MSKFVAGFPLPPANPKFTKRHYETIAQALMRSKPAMNEPVKREQWEETCLVFLNILQRDNPKFDRETFLHACKGG